MNLKARCSSAGWHERGTRSAVPIQTIKRVMLVQTEKREPQEDLSHVLLRWQEAGIEMLSKASGDTSLPSRISVPRPSRFKASWYRALAIMGLRRSSVGGFGSFIPETSAAG